MNAFPLDSEGRCALCRSGLRGFDAAYSFGAYDGALREMVHLLKYRKMRALAQPLGAFLLQALAHEESCDVIVPVPLHWRRHWDRGFNQSELLAKAMAREAGLRVTNALRRVQPTATQAGLSNSARRRNVTQAFRCHRPGAVRGKRILLVDDVMTTGSTATACAQALKRAGAKRVALLTVARVDRRLAGRQRLPLNSGSSDFIMGRTVRNGE